MSCGDGKRMRSRTCRGSAAECVGDATQEQSCKERECEIPCWAEWAEWTTCSKSCGTGIQERRRQKVNYPLITARFTISFTAWKCTSANPCGWDMVDVSDLTRLAYPWEEYQSRIVNGKHQVYNRAHKPDSYVSYVDVEACFLLLRAGCYDACALDTTSRLMR